MNRPLVSAVIPVYNCEQYLASAIESVLAQTYEPVEVIVVNDGSTDSSEEVARSYSPRVRCCSQPNMGIGAARNRGVSLAKGSFFAFLDSDDLWTGDKIAAQMKALEENPELDVVFGLIELFKSPELDMNTRKKIHIPSKVMTGYSAGTMLVRRDSFIRTGGFVTSVKVGEFVDWHLKSMEKGLKHLLLPKIVLKRRLHRANTGILEKKSRSDYLHILKASLDRRRKLEVKRRE